MHPVAVGGGGQAVGGGSDEWMRELDPRTYLEQPGVDSGLGRGHVDAEGLSGTVEQDGVAQGLRGRGDDEQMGVGWELEEAPCVALFDLAYHRLAPGQPEPAGEICGVPGARQLEERERVAVTLGNDLVAHGGVQWAVHVVQQQCAGIAVAQSADRQLGQPGEDVVAAAGAGPAYEHDPLSEEPSGDEPKDLRGGLVEPLRVVDDADQRLLLGDLGEQRQRGQPDQEPVGRGTDAQSEHGCECVALRDGQPLEVTQHGRAELMEAAVGQFHLRLDPDGRHETPVGDPVGQVAQQRALADACLPPQDGDTAPTGERVGEKPVERLALGSASEECWGLTAILARRRPPCARSPGNHPEQRSKQERTGAIGSVEDADQGVSQAVAPVEFPGLWPGLGSPGLLLEDVTGGSVTAGDEGRGSP